MISKKMLRMAKQQAKAAAAKEAAENPPLPDEEVVPRSIDYKIRKELREQKKEEGIESFKQRRKALAWQERRRRIAEGIMRTEWSVEDGQLVVIKEPNSRQHRLRSELKNANLVPGQSGIIIDVKDILPSGYRRDGKNKKIIVLVGADIQEWDASWIEDVD